MSALRSLWNILLPIERRSALVLLAMILVSTLLEMFSITLIVPTLAVMTRAADTVPPVARPWVERMGGLGSSRLMLTVLAGLVVVYALKAAYLLVVAATQSRFVATAQANISRRLFAVFMRQPWTFHLERNSAALTQAIAAAQQLSQVCLNLIQLSSEALVVSGLLALILWFEPAGALVVILTLGSATVLFNRVARRRTRRWARVRDQHAQLVFQYAQQGLGGVKEVKVRGCEAEFIAQFRNETYGVARMSARQSFIEQVPRMGYELASVAALFLLTAALLWQRRSPQDIVPVLGLFATVAFRLLPSINYGTLALQRVRSSEPMLERIQEHLALDTDAADATPAPPIAFRDRIRIEGLGYRYPSGHDRILQTIDITIPKGASVGLLGSSGAGKSTLVDALIGLLPPTAGRITVDGVDIRAHLRGWQALIGYVPQAIFLCDDTIRRNVAFGVPEDAIDDDAVHRALTAAQLDDFVRALPDGLDTRVRERGVRLSGGERQRIGIARALYHDPQVLVLDEATSALDTETEREVMATVEALHGTKTVIIVAHRLSTLAGCDVLYRMERGRIVQSGSFAEVVATRGSSPEGVAAAPGSGA